MAGLSLIPRPHLRLGMGQGKAVHCSPKLKFGRAKMSSFCPRLI